MWALAQQVAIATLRPSLAGAAVTAWCPGAPAPPPPGAWVCGSDLGGAIEVAPAQRPFGTLHRLAGAAELARRLQAELAQASLQPAEHLAQLALPVA